jgi:hypothetical protein
MKKYLKLTLFLGFVLSGQIYAQAPPQPLTFHLYVDHNMSSKIRVPGGIDFYTFERHYAYKAFARDLDDAWKRPSITLILTVGSDGTQTLFLLPDDFSPTKHYEIDAIVLHGLTPINHMYIKKLIATVNDAGSVGSYFAEAIKNHAIPVSVADDLKLFFYNFLTELETEGVSEKYGHLSKLIAWLTQKPFRTDESSNVYPMTDWNNYAHTPLPRSDRIAYALSSLMVQLHQGLMRFSRNGHFALRGQDFFHLITATIATAYLYMIRDTLSLNLQDMNFEHQLWPMGFIAFSLLHFLSELGIIKGLFHAGINYFELQKDMILNHASDLAKIHLVTRLPFPPKCDEVQ